MVRLKDEPKKEPSIPLEAGNPPPPNEIHGKVTDTTGTPLANASVIIKGTKHGVLTDGQGRFSITYAENNITLVVAYTGFVTKDVNPGADNSVVIVLRQSTNVLDEVISKGYYNTTNRLNIGDVSIVTAKEIEQQPVTDPLQALEGRVPGLYIQQTSGIPGSYGTVRLRGQNFAVLSGIGSITQNDPLYIVDGVPFNSATMTLPTGVGNALGQPVDNTGVGLGISPFNSLNPGDIETIEVLKDADATAIYGSRGANGVILITTKKGKAGKLQFNLSANTGYSSPAKTMPLLNTSQYLEMNREAIKNGNWGQYLYNPALISVYPSFTLWDTTRYTNWQKVLIGELSTLSSLQADLSGGNAYSQYLISGGLSKNTPPFPGSYSDTKGSLHMNLSCNSQDMKFKAALSASYVHDNNNIPLLDFTQYINLPPDAPAIYDKFGNLNWEVYQNRATWGNPFANTINSASTISNNLISNLNLSYQIIPDLNVGGSLGYNHVESNQENLQFSQSVAPPLNTNPLERDNGTGIAVNESWIAEPHLNYKKGIRKHHIDITIGGSFMQSTFSSSSTKGQGFPSEALVGDLLAASKIYNGLGYSLYRYEGVYGRIGYNWDEKYIINLDGRRDGSSRFGPGNQFGNFGSAGAGWIFSQEPFMQYLVPALNFGKLRGSYGVTGADGIGDYQYLSLYKFTGVQYDNISGLSLNGLSNPYYHWPSLQKLEGGLDMGFFKDRIRLSASYYYDYTGNQLTNEGLPAVTGAPTGSVAINYTAHVINYGSELTLNTINIKTLNFSWTSSFNISRNQNKLLSYGNVQNPELPAPGASLFSTPVYHYLGVDPETGIYSFATKSPNGSNPAYPQETVLSKPITQSYFGGLVNTITYKGFRLDFLFQFTKQLGYDYQNSWTWPGHSGYNQPVWVLGRWQKPGDITSVQEFALRPNSATNAYSTLVGSDGVITDASFIRLKNVGLSYQFSSAWLKKAKMESLSIYLRCQNLFTLTHYQGMDPESGGSNLPPLRTVNMGLQIGL